MMDSWCSFKGGGDNNTKTSNTNLAQAEQTDAVHTATSYFDPMWNSFSSPVWTIGMFQMVSGEGNPASASKMTLK